MNYLKNIKLLYAHKFFHNLIFAYVIERLFWAQRGMTIQHVVYTEIIYAVTIIILEIPTGILADKWSRKNLLIISSLLTFLEFYILIYSYSFWQFGLVALIAGISTSLASGSENALLYDSLKHHAKENTFEKVLGRLRAFDFAAATIGGLCGGFLAFKFNFEFNYWISLISISIALIISFFIKETTLHTQNVRKEKFITYFKKAWNYFKNNRNVALVISSGIVLGSCTNYVDEFWQLYLKELSFPIVFFGVFTAVTTIVVIPGSLISYKLKEKFQYKTLFIILICIFVCILFVIALCSNYMGIIAIGIIGFVMGILDPLVSGYLHHRIPSEIRATMDSFQSLVGNAMSILIGLVFGYACTRFSIFGGFTSLAIACLIYLMFFILALKKTKL